MAEPREVQPVALFVGMLSASAETFAEVEPELVAEWGPVQFRSDVWPHEFTDYYDDEMGRPLWRLFLAFERPFDPGQLAAVKLRTNAVERRVAELRRWPAARPINLDPGYVTPSKLVLASCKDYTHRIYLGQGVYAEPTLGYTGGRWVSYAWTYPDYQTAEYQAFFDVVRRQLLERRRRNRPS
jgi:hypothetical protein